MAANNKSGLYLSMYSFLFSLKDVFFPTFVAFSGSLNLTLFADGFIDLCYDQISLKISQKGSRGRSRLRKRDVIKRHTTSSHYVTLCCIFKNKISKTQP